MTSRRNFLLGTASLGAVSRASESRAVGPKGDPDDESLRPLLAKSAYIFAGEVVSVGDRAIGCGNGPSLLEQSCTFRVDEAILGARPEDDVQVTIVRYSDEPGPEIKAGATLVLFLKPFREWDGLGTPTNPYVTTDKWFAVQRRSRVLADTLSRLAGPRG
jgi:hypothetical protein